MWLTSVREVVVIDSQPSASRPSNPRVAKRRPAKHRAAPSGSDSGSNARWKVQLELAPAEIALVYKQGLARGAEVCRQGTHEWRPLVTTPELRFALASGRGLATLARRPQKKPASIAPPPPAVVKRELTPELMQTFSPVVTPLEAPALPTSAAELAPLPPPRAKATSFAWLVQHARPAELALVAGAAVLLTWMASALTHRVQASSASTAAAAGHERMALQSAAADEAPAAASFGPGAAIPVVSVTDLPVEGQRALRGAAMKSGATPQASGMRAQLARALGNAARAAQSCGSGPVNTQIVATFAPSGVARAIHFGAGAPPAALRSCVLNAVARARISPFEGEPVIVSKTLRW